MHKRKEAADRKAREARERASRPKRPRAEFRAEANDKAASGVSALLREGEDSQGDRLLQALRR